MSSLQDKLSLFESRLQSLIEQGTTRIVPKGGYQNQISSKLIAAMQSSIKLDEAGRPIAADTYILVVDQETAQLLAEDPSIIEELLQILIEAGAKSEVSYQALPKIKISAESTMEPGRFEILSHYGIQEIAETSTLAIDPNDGMPVPEYAFLIISGGQVHPITEQVVNLGRRPDNHIVIDDPRVSRTHAQIRAINGRYVIFDLDSTGGMFVNNVCVNQSTLFPGDVISLAGVDLVYGQDAAYLSNGDSSSTQPLMPFPNSED
jgi:hypothetical protein